MSGFKVGRDQIVGHGNIAVGTDLLDGQDTSTYGKDIRGQRGTRVRRSLNGAPVGFDKNELSEIQMTDIEMSEEGGLISATNYEPGEQGHPLAPAKEEKCQNPKSPMSPEIPEATLSQGITEILEGNSSPESKIADTTSPSPQPSSPKRKRKTSSQTNSEVTSQLKTLTDAVKLLSTTCEQMQTSLTDLRQKQSSPSVSVSKFEVVFQLPLGRFKFEASDVSTQNELLYVVFEADSQYLTPEEGMTCAIEVTKDGEGTSFSVVSTGLTHRLRIDGKERIIVVFGLV